MQVGKFFLVGIFLLNLQAILYGNQTNNCFETEAMLIGLADCFNAFYCLQWAIICIPSIHHRQISLMKSDASLNHPSQ